MGTLHKCNIDIETGKQKKTERQRDNKTKDDEQDSKDIQTTYNDLLRSKKGEWGDWGWGRCHLDFLIYDLK